MNSKAQKLAYGKQSEPDIGSHRHALQIRDLDKTKKMKKPILFVKAGCPWCIDAMAYFESKQVKLDIIDLRVDPQRMDELVGISGQTKTPTLKLGDFVVADFDLEEFEAALAKNPEAKRELGL